MQQRHNDTFYRAAEVSGGAEDCLNSGKRGEEESKRQQQKWQLKLNPARRLRSLRGQTAAGGTEITPEVC